MRNNIFIVVFVLSVTLTRMISAEPVELHESGQQRCYDQSGNELVTCIGTLQDGDLLPGVAWPNPRFVRGTGVESDCMIDRLTGLMWIRNPTDTLMDWASALDAALNLMLCGHADWRMPNVKEMHSLVNFNEVDSAVWLNGQGFGVNITTHYIHWTSSSYISSPDAAMVVSLLPSAANGTVGAFNKDSSAFYILPVRRAY